MNTTAERSVAKKICTLLLAALAWFAVILQLIITTGSFANFLSYFTIECNLLVAVSLTVTGLFPRSKPGIFFSKLSVQSAIALYIFIVGLVYNLVLRGIWEPKGWQLLADNLLHVAVPVLYVLYWVFFRSPGKLYWRDGFYWMIFPLAYLIYSLIRGEMVHWYPYPFLNVVEHGYAKVLLNVALMILVFFVAGLIVIWITRVIKAKTKSQHGT